MFRGNSDVMFHAKDQLVLERGYKTLYIRHRCTRRMVCKERKCQLIIRLFFVIVRYALRNDDYQGGSVIERSSKCGEMSKAAC